MNSQTAIPAGDRHDGQRVVLVTDGANSWYRKPRSAKTVKTLEAFLLSLRQEGFLFAPACEHVMEEGDGWYHAAVVAHSPAKTAEDAALYFRRCGALLFFAWLLGSTDLHEENLIACKDTPVLIDTETLFSASFDPPSDSPKNLTGTVLRSHLLPNWRMENGRAALCAGLIGAAPDGDNMLQFEGLPCYLYDHTEAVCEGFSAAWRFALSHREWLKSAMRQFDGCESRVLLRPTEVYDRLVRLARVLPEERRCPALLTLLSAAHQNDVRQDRAAWMEQVIQAEAEAVLKGDIPYFTVRFDSSDLCSGGRTVREGFFAASPAETIHSRIDTLNEASLEAQLRIIKQSISAARPEEKRPAPCTAGTDPLQTGFSLLEEGCLSVLPSGWMRLDRGTDGNLYLLSAGYGLYDGLAGILCAYAALYHATDRAEIRAAMLTHAAPLLDLAEHMGPQRLDSRTACLQSGVGGMIAALLHSAELAGEQAFYEAACRLAGKIEPKPAEDSECDLLTGIGGLALQLPKLPPSVARPLAKAMLPLLGKTEPRLTGAAHGAAGQALALAAAQSALGTTDYDGTILRLLAFEETHFYPEENNWRDLRDRTEVRFMNGWCSGAPGVALCRSRLMELSQHPAIRAACERDLARASKTLPSEFRCKRDCLCCGNAARLMALSRLGMKNRPLADALRKRLRTGYPALLHVGGTDDFSFGLMQGLAGVVYALAMEENNKSGGMLL